MGRLAQTLGVATTTMATSAKLDRLHLRVRKFPGPELALHGLAFAREVVENQITEARTTEIKRLRADHAARAEWIHPDDAELDVYELGEKVTRLLPRIFRTGFMLVTWSTFETKIKDMLYYVAQEKGQPIPAKFFKSKNIFDAAEQYLQQSLSMSAFPDRSIREALNELSQVRNALVHHSGKTTELPSPLCSLSAPDLERAGFLIEKDLHNAYAVPTEEYIQAALLKIDTYLRSLSGQVFNALHPPPNSDA